MNNIITIIIVVVALCFTLWAILNANGIKLSKISFDFKKKSKGKKEKPAKKAKIKKTKASKSKATETKSEKKEKLKQGKLFKTKFKKLEMQKEYDQSKSEVKAIVKNSVGAGKVEKITKADFNKNNISLPSTSNLLIDDKTDQSNQTKKDNQNQTASEKSNITASSATNNKSDPFDISDISFDDDDFKDLFNDEELERIFSKRSNSVNNSEPKPITSLDLLESLEDDSIDSSYEALGLPKSLRNTSKTDFAPGTLSDIGVNTSNASKMSNLGLEQPKTISAFEKKSKGKYDTSYQSNIYKNSDSIYYNGLSLGERYEEFYGADGVVKTPLGTITAKEVVIGETLAEPKARTRRGATRSKFKYM